MLKVERYYDFSRTKGSPIYKLKMRNFLSFSRPKFPKKVRKRSWFSPLSQVYTRSKTRIEKFRKESRRDACSAFVRKYAMRCVLVLQHATTSSIMLSVCSNIYTWEKSALHVTPVCLLSDQNNLINARGHHATLSPTIKFHLAICICIMPSKIRWTGRNRSCALTLLVKSSQRD